MRGEQDEVSAPGAAADGCLLLAGPKASDDDATVDGGTRDANEAFISPAKISCQHAAATLAFAGGGTTGCCWN